MWHVHGQSRISRLCSEQFRENFRQLVFQWANVVIAIFPREKKHMDVFERGLRPRQTSVHGVLDCCNSYLEVSWVLIADVRMCGVSDECRWQSHFTISRGSF